MVTRPEQRRARILTHPARRVSGTSSLLAILLLVVTACASSPSGDDGRAVVRDLRRDVVSAAEQVTRHATELGLRVREATGSYSICGMEPAFGVEYRALLNLALGGAQAAEAVRAVVDALVSDDWVLSGGEREGADPYANLESGGVRVSVEISRAVPGSLDIGVTRPCTDVDRDVVDSVETGEESLS